MIETILAHGIALLFQVAAFFAVGTFGFMGGERKPVNNQVIFAFLSAVILSVAAWLAGVLS